MAGTSKAKNPRGIDTGHGNHFADRRAAVFPEFGEITLDMAWLGEARLAVDGAMRDLVALRVEKHGLYDRVSDIDAQNVVLLSHGYKCPMLLRRWRAGG